jgi:hypothetical protein
MTFVGLGDGARNPLRGQRVFSAQKDVGDVGFDGESGDDRPFYELVRIRSINSRSLNVPGSISSALTTR